MSQGITTLAVGQDGSSPWPIAGYVDRLRANPPAVNVVVLAGHATIRTQVMGQDYKRRARPAEVARMRTLVDQAMAEGAVGLSSGLEYEVGTYSDIEEVVEMARAAGARGGYYISHIRDEADLALDAIREAIAIGERGKLPVQITHIKLGTVGVWGKAKEVVALVEAAQKRGVDVTADAYPYLAWQSTPKVLVPSKRYDDPVSVKRGLDDIGGARNVQITRWGAYPQYIGKRLDEMARAEGLTDIEAYIRFARDDDAGMIGHAMIEDDLRVFYQQPWVMVASDGGIANNHPRGAGTFPRVLGRYVREQPWLTLPEAIRKMTSMPAARMGLKDRGRIAVGHEGRPRALRPGHGRRPLHLRATARPVDRDRQGVGQRRAGVGRRRRRQRAARPRPDALTAVGRRSAAPRRCASSSASRTSRTSRCLRSPGRT